MIFLYNINRFMTNKQRNEMIQLAETQTNNDIKPSVKLSSSKSSPALFI